MSQLKSETFERIILASVVNGYDGESDGLADLAISRLSEHHFTSAGRQYIFNLIRVVREAGQSVNADIISSYVQDDNELMAGTVPEEIAQLYVVSVQPNIDELIKTLKEYHKARLIENIGVSIQTRLERAVSIPNELNEIYQEFEDVFVENASGDGSFVGDLLTPFIQSLIDAKKHDGLLGTSLGITDLDNTTGGIRGGETCVVAGLPGMGKTSWALSMACRNVAEDKGVAIFSMEMTEKELIGRMIPMYSQIMGYKNLKYSQIRNPKYLGQDAFATVSAVAKEIKDKKLYIDDSARTTVQDIRSTCYKLRAEGALDMIIVDYLQLMIIDDNNAAHELSNISGELKRIGKEFDIPVIELSQLNIRDTKGARPCLGNLKGSGSLEANADAVIFPWREYAITKEGDPTNMVMLIAKGRAFDGKDVPVRFSTDTLLVSDRLSTDTRCDESGRGF